MDLELRGRSVLITGGSKGLGHAMAERFLQEGARVTICGRDPAALDAAVDTLAAHGDVRGVRADVGSDADVKRLVDDVERAYGRLDVLVNNAGRIRPGKIADFDDETWLQELNGKLMGTVRVTRHALRILNEDGCSAVINLSGLTGKQLFPNGVITGVINAGVIAFTKYLSEELAPRRIRANSVCPGVVRTRGWEERGAAMARAQGLTPEEFFADFVARHHIHAGRWGRPEEIADLVVLLASPRLSYMTGQTLVIDGGFAKFIA